MAKKREMQVSYPIVIKRKIRLYHNLTQIHFQRFYEQASARMASIQGLKVNEDTDDEIAQIEALFNEVLENANNDIQEIVDNWKSKLEDAGVDPSLENLQGGVELEAPVTTPWSNKYFEIYKKSDNALMLIEMAWIGEEIQSVLEKRDAINKARKPLTDITKQVQRAVTKAFQEASNKTKKPSATTHDSWGKDGKLLSEKAPEVVEFFAAVQKDPVDKVLFDETVQALSNKHAESGEEVLNAIHAISNLMTQSLYQEKEAKKKKA